MGNLERIIITTPLLIPAIFLTVGILICPEHYQSFDYKFLLFGIALIIISSIIYVLLTNKNLSIYQRYRYRNLHYSWLALSFFGLGIVITVFKNPCIKNVPDTISGATVSGTVLDIKNSTSGDILLIDAVLISDNLAGNYYPHNLKLKIHSATSQISYGDIICFNSDLNRIEDSQNTFRKGYADQLSKQGILYEGYIDENGYSIAGNKHTLLSFSKEIRDKFEIYIEHARLAKSTKNFLITILLGDRDYIDNDTRQLFAESGTSHILALSGLHIGIIVGFLLAIFFPFNFIGKYKFQLIFSMVFLWGYAFLCGFTPSAVRACAMCSFAFISIILERKNSLINSICFAYMLILLFSPNSIYEAGFQLSFLCVFVIVTLMPHLKIVNHRKHKYIFSITSLIFVTFIVTACSWVLTSYYFHTFSLSFLFTNTLCLPILPLFLLISIFYIIACNCGIYIPFIKVFLDEGLSFFNSFQKFCSEDTVLFLQIPIESVTLWIMAILLIVIYLNIFQHRLVAMSACFCAMVSLLCIFIFPNEYKDNDFIVCNNYNEVGINYIKDNKEDRIMLKRNACDSVRIGRYNIVTVDEKNPYNKIPHKCDFLIVCGGFTGSISQLLENRQVFKVVIHPSVRKKKENAWIEEMGNLNFPYHSLRLHKSLIVEE